MRILSAVLALILAATAQAQSLGGGSGATNNALDTVFNSIRVGQVSPFGEMGTYELRTVLNYQSTWGLTDRHDIVTTTNSGTVDLEGGFLSLETGTTTNSTAELTTVEYGRYEPGRAAEAGLGFFPTTIPTGTGVEVKWGAYTDANGAYWRIKDSDTDGSNELCVVYEAASSESETCGVSNFNGQTKPSDFDPFNDGAIYVVRFNWYGVGGAAYFAYYADSGSSNTLSRWLIHRFAPADGQSFGDPNLPITITVDNGSTTSNVEAQVGGRRYDIQGAQNFEVRRNGEFRNAQAVAAADGLVPLICMRRESEFPSGTGRENTVAAYLDGFDVVTDQRLAIYLVLDPNVTGGTWTTPTNREDDETVLDSNKGVTALSNADALSGPWMIGTAGMGATATGTKDASGFRIQLPGADPMCLAADIMTSTDATVSSTMRVVEGW